MMAKDQIQAGLVFLVAVILQKHHGQQHEWGIRRGCCVMLRARAGPNSGRLQQMLAGGELQCLWLPASGAEAASQGAQFGHRVPGLAVLRPQFLSASSSPSWRHMSLLQTPTWQNSTAWTACSSLAV